MSHTTTRGRFATATAVRYEYEVTLSIELQVFVYYFDQYARKIISLQERRNKFQRKRRNKTQFLPISRIKYITWHYKAIIYLTISARSVFASIGLLQALYKDGSDSLQVCTTESTSRPLFVSTMGYFLNFLPRKIMFDVDIDLYVVDLQLNRLQAIADIFR